MSFPATLDLSSLNGQNGFVINGIDGAGALGTSVSNLGDINGDGLDDIIIGAPLASSSSGTTEAGKSYVIFGRRQGFGNSFNLQSLNGSNGFAINGIDKAGYLGFSVSGAGDVNGDGFDDIIIGAPQAEANLNDDSGESYLILGRPQGFGSNFDPANLGSLIFGGTTGGHSGLSVSSAGDVNGDGFGDLIIGAPSETPDFDNVSAGNSYIVFGRGQGFPDNVPLWDRKRSDVFRLQGDFVVDYSGTAVSSAGDINGDGVDDVMISAPGANRDTGATYVVFGTNQQLNSNALELKVLNGNNGFVINGTSAPEPSNDVNLEPPSTTVSSAGDVNGDGFDDIIVGAPLATPFGGPFQAGESYVIFGRRQGFSASFEPSSLNGVNGFVISGGQVEGKAGWSVSGAGDVNGDGFDDVLIGAPGSNNSLGESYVVFGSGQGFGARVDLSSLNGSNGFAIRGGNAVLSGGAVSGAGDLNGDGFDDLIIGAPGSNNTTGAAYVILGRGAGSTVGGTSAAIEWNTQTSVVSSFSIDVNTRTANSTPIGRTIQDKNWELQTTGDLNGDGQADVILRHALAGQNLAWYMAPGGQSIQSEVLIGRDVPDTNWSIGGTGDLNADGNVDIILRNQAADQIVAWYMDGDGNIQGEALIGRGFGDNNWKIEAVADFNGDSKSDIVLRNGLSGQNVLWEMDGATILAESLIGRDLPDQNWHIEGARDFDNNGTVDLFLRHRGVGQGLLWSMADKTTIATEQLIANVPTGVSQLVF